MQKEHNIVGDIVGYVLFVVFCSTIIVEQKKSSKKMCLVEFFGVFLIAFLSNMFFFLTVSVRSLLFFSFSLNNIVIL